MSTRTSHADPHTPEAALVDHDAFAEHYERPITLEELLDKTLAEDKEAYELRYSILSGINPLTGHLFPTVAAYDASIGDYAPLDEHEQRLIEDSRILIAQRENEQNHPESWIHRTARKLHMS